MKTVEIINTLQQAGVKFGCDGQKLSCELPKKGILTELRKMLVDNSESIKAYFLAKHALDNKPCIAKRNIKIGPASLSQQRFWMIDQLSNDKSIYNIPFSIEVSQRLDANDIRSTFAALIERHGALRTTFSEVQGEVQQTVLEDYQCTLTVEDLSDTAPANKSQKLEQMTAHYIQQPFDLSSDLLLRPVLFILEKEGEHIVKSQILFILHHIAQDGWSMGVLQREFLQIYQSIKEKQPIGLAPSAIEYIDYAAWQRELSDRGIFDIQLDYWKAKLADSPLVHGLRLDNPRGTGQVPTAEQVIGELGNEYKLKLQTLSAQYRVSPFIMLHAVLALLLSKYTNSHDIVIGIPVANRDDPAVANVVGCFINSLALRVNTDFSSFAEYIEHVKQVHFEAQSNRDVPFDLVVEKLAFERTNSHPPLFQIFLNTNIEWANLSADSKERDIDKSGFSYIESKNTSAMFDLDIEVGLLGDGIRIQWGYDASLFNKATIEQYDTHFCALLTGVLEQPERDLKSNFFLSLHDKQQLMNDFNGARRNYPHSQITHQRFEQMAAQHPDKIAVVHHELSFTYQELNTAANKLANYLITNQLVDKPLVGIYADRSPLFLMSILAIMKAGAAYVPIDPINPKDRIDYIVNNAHIETVLSNEHYQSHCQDMQITHILCLEDYQTYTRQCSEENPKCEVDADDLAYMIYTSGSTGMPKGALVHHAGLINHLDAEFDLLGFMTPSGDLKPTNFLQSAACSSDVSVWQFLAPVLSGGKTVIVDSMLEVEQMVTTIAEHQVQLVQVAPAIFQLLMERMEQAPETVTMLSCLEWLMTIAEPTPIELINRWFKACPYIPIMNGYGPSEASDDISYFIMREPLSELLPSVPVGKPIPNLTLYVLNSQLELLPIGAVGEIFVSGVGVGHGYWKNEEKTKHSFVSNPYFDDPSFDVFGDTLYRTGDLGRWTSDGELELIGRIDNQVKVRGYRVELGEIEAAISAVEGIGEVAVLLKDDMQGDKYLAAYLVARGGKTLDSSMLREAIQHKLPDYMLPTSYTWLSELPLNAADKIDRIALAAMQVEEQPQCYIAPANEVEKQLVQIWARLSKREEDKVCCATHFFDLGGHSLLFVRFISDIRDIFNAEVAVTTVFEHSNIQALAQYIEHQASKGVRLSIAPRCDSLEHIPLSFAQRRLWFIDQLQQGSAEYNVPVLLEVSGQLDLRVATQAFQEIVTRHESLRTVYIETQTDVAQLCITDVEFNIQVHEVDSEAEVDELVDRIVTAPFDLSKDLMLRADIITTKRNGSYQEHDLLVINMHHIASDGWSMQLLINEFCTLYQAYKNNQPNPLTPLSLQYADYAVWQHDWSESKHLESQLEYWRRHLADVPAVHTIPLDYVRSEVQKHQGKRISQSISASVSNNLLKLAKQHQVTPFMLLHGLLCLVLERHGNSQDIVIGTPMANRLQRELEPLIGFFINMVVLRANTDFDNLSDYLSHIKSVNLSAQANQEVPFEQLIDELDIPRTQAHTPLFQIMMMANEEYGQLTDSEDSIYQLPDVELNMIETSVTSSKYDIEIEINMSAEGGVIYWTYDLALFKQKHMEAILGHLVNMLGAVSESMYSDNISPQLRTLECLGVQEQAAILMPNSLVEHKLDEMEDHLTKRFEMVASQYPNNVAVNFENYTLTYRELNERANQLAHHLSTQFDLSQHELIGLSTERSVEMLIGLLAILKAGCAYLPLDPDYPQERLAHMQQDAGIDIVITTDYGVSKVDFTATNVVLINQQNVNDGAIYPRVDFALYDKVNLDKVKPRCTDLAYVIYTSGSTGKSKGVMVEHGNVIRLFRASAAHFDFSQHDVWTLFHSYAFDFSVWEIWGALLFGGELVIVPQHIARQPDEFAHLLCTKQVTVLSQTPSAFIGLSDTNILKPEKVALRYVVFGGEALAMSSLMPWVEKFGVDAPELINMYGITETTVHVTFKKVDKMTLSQSCSNIGRSLNDLNIVLLSPTQTLTPLGAVGEMYVSGGGVTRGYLNKPELTASRFTSLHHVTNDGQLYYRTGDLARYLENGELEYLGRIDNQVKIRGFRIELGEIETQICHYEQVDSALVLVLDAPVGGQQIVAYVKKDLSQSNASDNGFVTRLRNYLSQHLPEYMLPKVYVEINSWPLNANGKVDKSALPEIAEASFEQHYVAPKGAAETLLCEIFETVLGRSKVSVLDDYFTIGGDSILSIRVVAMAKSHGLAMKIEDLFKFRTIQAIAENLKDTQETNLTSEIQPFSLLNESERIEVDELKQLYNLEDVYPLSSLQQGMMFHYLLSQEHGTYHDIFSAHVGVSWSEGHFSTALAQLVSDNELLRSHVYQSTSRPLHLIHHDINLPFKVIDLRHFDTSQFDAALGEWQQTELEAGFAENAPLWSATVHLRHDDTFQFGLSFHHALLDGWSVATLQTKLMEHYQCTMREQPLSPVVPPSYKYFVAQESRAIGNKEDREFWLNLVEQAKLPWWTGREKKASHPVQFAFTGRQFEQIQSLANELSVQEKSIFLTMYMMLLDSFNGHKKTAISVVFNGRPALLGSESTLGLFLNSLPFNLDYNTETWHALIQLVDEKLSDMAVHANYPLAELQQLCELDFSGALFNYVNFHVYEEVEQTGLAQQAQTFEETNYLFAVTVAKGKQHYAMDFQLDSGVFGTTTVQHITGYVERIMQGILEHGGSEHVTTTLLGESEQTTKLKSWNNTYKAFAHTLCIHERFEQQVVSNPQAPALHFEGQSLTYAQLNVKANQLAHRLKAEFGIGTGKCVGIAIERSFEMVIAVLATLKAGGAYVPIDREIPVGRVEKIVEQASPQLLLIDPELATELSNCDIEVITTDKVAVSEGFSPDNLAREASGVTALDPAYIIFTSGSTGQPKGVVVSHQALHNRVDWMDNQYTNSSSDRILMKTPFSFDVSVWEYVWPLCTGAQAVIAKPGGHRDPHYIAELICRSQVSKCHFVPSMLEVMLEQRVLADCNSLQMVFCSGEALTSAQVKEFNEQTPRIQLHNLYGPTEAAIDVSYYDCSNTQDSVIPIGKPIQNIQLYVLDESLRIVPHQGVGELYIGGVGLAQGYLNQPTLTEKSFIPNPYFDKQMPFSSQRLYKTGDLARYREDGNIEYLGRKDEQVKLRGQRIEIGEIEYHITQCECVESAQIIVTEQATGNPQLVAFIKRADEQLDSPVSLLSSDLSADIVAFLHTQVPAYMVPEHFFQVSGWQLTSNGKINKKYLRTLDLPICAVTVTRPETDIEHQLSAMWSELLGIDADQISVTRDFVDLGGNSLMALRLLHLIQTRYELKLTVKHLMEYRTVRALAGCIQHLVQQNKLAEKLTTEKNSQEFII